MKLQALILILIPICCLSCNTDKASSSRKAVTLDADAVYFKKVKEPNEGAFSVLVPDGWHTKGGIFRLDPSKSGGAGNAIAAKYDFSVRNNKNADVEIRWLPDYLFMDMRFTPAAAYFPQGSNNNGMEVVYKMDPVTFIMKKVIPYAHPNISKLRKTGQKSLNGLAKTYQNYASANPMLTMSYRAALARIEYTENGKAYEEIIIAVVEDYGQIGAGLWGNKGCLYVRTPKGEMDQWASILETIHTSVEINTQWLAGEIKGQQQRGSTMLNVQREMQNIDREIAAHQQKVNQEIHNDMYLTLTEQEEYVNPHTQKVEIGTNQWQHRWQNDQGEIIYTNNEDYEPNHDPDRKLSGFKRSAIRER